MQSFLINNTASVTLAIVNLNLRFLSFPVASFFKTSFYDKTCEFHPFEIVYGFIYQKSARFKAFEDACVWKVARNHNKEFIEISLLLVHSPR